MKALSIQQPWAELIVSGVKDIENRSWSTNFRGEVLVHSPLGFDDESFIALQERGWFKGKTKADFDRGGVVGKTTITDCVTISKSPWFFGDFGFVLQGSERLPFYPYKGQLGFFDIQLPNNE